MKKQELFLQIAACIILLTGCEQTQNQQLVENSNSTQKILNTNIDHKEISVKHDVLGYFNKVFYYDCDSIEYLYSMDDQSSRLDIYDISNLSYLKSINLNMTGPDNVGDFYDYFIISQDSILVIAPYQLSILSQSGNLINKWPLNQNDNSEFVYSFGAIGSHRLHFDDYTNEIFIGLSYHINREEVSFYEGSIETKLSFPTLKQTNIEVYYPSIYQEQSNYYALLSYPNRTINNTYLIFNFPVDPNIYLYNRESSALEIKGGKSKYFSQHVAQSLRRNNINSDDHFRQFIESPNYFEVIPDSYRNIYYRIQAHPMDYLDASGNPRAWNEKKMSLTIFDKKFNIIDEIMLDNRIYSPQPAFVTQEGLWISRENSNNINNQADIIEYDVFKFELIDE